MSASGRLDRVLVAVLLAAVCCWMVRAHWENVDQPKMAAKQRLHRQVLENDAPDPYQYKLWLISGLFDATQSVFDGPLFDDVRGSTGQNALGILFYANTLLSLAFLVLLHHLWLRAYFDAKIASVGCLALAALANVLFLNFYHHPYEFWGLGLYCLMCRGVAKAWPWWALALLGLVTGLVYEKHFLVAALWGVLALRQGRAFWPSLARGVAILLACLVVPVVVRIHLGPDRAMVDGDTPLSVQKWDLVAWYQLPYVLPFLLILLIRFRAVPAWVRLLWVYFPLLVAAYASQSYILHEVRSFWALTPVFTATLCAWLAHATQRRDEPSTDLAAG